MCVMLSCQHQSNSFQWFPVLHTYKSGLKEHVSRFITYDNVGKVVS